MRCFSLPSCKMFFSLLGTSAWMAIATLPAFAQATGSSSSTTTQPLVGDGTILTPIDTPQGSGLATSEGTLLTPIQTPTGTSLSVPDGTLLTPIPTSAADSLSPSGSLIQTSEGQILTPIAIPGGTLLVNPFGSSGSSSAPAGGSSAPSAAASSVRRPVISITPAPVVTRPAPLPAPSVLAQPTTPPATTFDRSQCTANQVYVNLPELGGGACLNRPIN